MDSLFLAFAVLVILFWGVVLFAWANVNNLYYKAKEFFRNG